MPKCHSAGSIDAALLSDERSKLYTLEACKKWGIKSPTSSDSTMYYKMYFSQLHKKHTCTYVPAHIMEKLTHLREKIAIGNVKYGRDTIGRASLEPGRHQANNTQLQVPTNLWPSSLAIEDATVSPLPASSHRKRHGKDGTGGILYTTELSPTQTRECNTTVWQSEHGSTIFLTTVSTEVKEDPKYLLKNDLTTIAQRHSQIIAENEQSINTTEAAIEVFVVEISSFTQLLTL